MSGSHDRSLTAPAGSQSTQQSPINYIPQRDGPIPGLEDGSLSSSEMLQRQLGTADVAKVFGNVTFWYLDEVGRMIGGVAGYRPVSCPASVREPLRVRKMSVLVRSGNRLAYSRSN